VTGINKGRARQLKSCVGRLSITKKQASRLGVPPYKRLSPVLETCCLLLCANESFQNAQTDIETLTGVKVGHSTQHRRVGNREWSFPDAKQAISEVSIRPLAKVVTGVLWGLNKSARSSVLCAC
jgi:hypothetical protein